VGDQTLTVETGVDLHTENSATGGIRTSADGNTTLVFEGDSKISADIGNNLVRLKTIEVTGDGKKVEFQNKVNLTANLEISKGATAIVQDQALIGGQIRGTNAGEGTLKFTNKIAFNSKDSNAVSAKIGSGAKLNTVEIAGADITLLSDDFKTDNLKFTRTGKTTLTFEGAVDNELNNTTITTTSTSRDHHLVLPENNAGIKSTKSIGTADNPFGNIIMLGDNNTIIMDDGDFYAGLVNNANKTGTIVFNKNGGVALNLGTKDSELNNVAVGGDTTFNENVYSANIEIKANQAATFKKSVSGSSNLLLDTNSIVTVEGENIDIAIDAKTNAGEGRLNLSGITNINKMIGATKK